MNKKFSFKLIVLLLVAIFAAIFIARCIYNLVSYEDTDMYDYFGYSSTLNMMAPMKNIAFERMVYETARGIEVLDQKYEMVASLTSRTTNYNEDEKALRAAIEECLAIIQMESKTGLEGSRRISMTIGVKPDYFDAAVEKISKIGTITSFSTTKTDKTQEYLQIVAEQEKLQRQKDSLEALKSEGGSITELLVIEDRLILVEAELQQQSVLLSDYSEDNALCTIHFTISEGSIVSIWMKLWNALTWSAMVYASFLGVLILVLAVAAFAIFVIKSGKKLYADTPIKQDDKTKSN